MSSGGDAYLGLGLLPVSSEVISAVVRFLFLKFLGIFLPSKVLLSALFYPLNDVYSFKSFPAFKDSISGKTEIFLRFLAVSLVKI